MPALSHWFGLKWSDIETMPNGELNEYLDQLYELERRLSKKA